MKKLTIVLALLIFSSPAYSETINPDPHFCPILKKVVETQIKKFTKGLKEKTISDRNLGMLSFSGHFVLHLKYCLQNTLCLQYQIIFKSNIEYLLTS